jgi:hypothetical protein
MLTRLRCPQELSTCLIGSLLILIPTAATAQNFNFNFSSPVVLAPTETPGAWYPDRFPPCGFSSPATAPDGTPNTLQESICATDFQTPTPSFYNTQGRKFDLPAGTTSVSIKLYVPLAWSTQNQREAGFWATAVNSTNVVGNDFPIIEFQGPTTSQLPGPSYQPNGGIAGFYGWNNVTGTFFPIGLPPGFVYNSWVTLTITVIPGTGFEYTVANPVTGFGVSILSPFFDPTETGLSNVILEGYNYDANYSIFWGGTGPGNPVTFDKAFQVSYAANPSAGESYINIINTGANGDPILGPGLGGASGNVCVNVYAFDPGEEMISCCSCLVTPNQVVNLGVNANLTVKTLTGVIPTSVTVKLLNTLAGTGGTGLSCTNSATAAGGANFPIVNGIVAYGTTPQAIGTKFNVVEHPFIPSTLSPAELASLTNRCSNIVGNGSLYGICSACRLGALGASKL